MERGCLPPSDGNSLAVAAGPESLVRGTTEDAGRDHGKKSESSEGDVRCSCEC